MNIGTISILLMSALTGACSTGISGVVLDFEDKPIFSPHAKINIVRLSSSDHEANSQIVELEEDGSFENTEDLEPGEYFVEPLVPGYRATSIRTKLEDSIHLRIQMDAIQADDGPTSIKPNMNVKLGRGAGSANLTPPKY